MRLRGGGWQGSGYERILTTLRIWGFVLAQRETIKNSNKCNAMSRVAVWKDHSGVPAVAQRDQRCLWRTGTQVWSLAQRSGLRLLCCGSCSVGCSCALDSILGPGTAIWSSCSQKREKKIGSRKERFGQSHSDNPDASAIIGDDSFH